MTRRIEGQQGSARRRLFWEHEGVITAAPQRPPLRPGGALPGDRSYTPRESRREIGQEYASVVPTIWGAILTGLGFGVGFAIVDKIIKR